MISPVGGLLVQATTVALKRVGRTHASEAPCGCRVTVSSFTTESVSINIERCTDHALDPGRKL